MSDHDNIFTHTLEMEKLDLQVEHAQIREKLNNAIKLFDEVQTFLKAASPLDPAHELYGKVQHFLWFGNLDCDCGDE
jgi:hypothetical protein